MRSRNGQLFKFWCRASPWSLLNRWIVEILRMWFFKDRINFHAIRKIQLFILSFPFLNLLSCWWLFVYNCLILIGSAVTDDFFEFPWVSDWFCLIRSLRRLFLFLNWPGPYNWFIASGVSPLTFFIVLNFRTLTFSGPLSLTVSTSKSDIFELEFLLGCFLTVDKIYNHVKFIFHEGNLSVHFLFKGLWFVEAPFSFFDHGVPYFSVDLNIHSTVHR